MFKVVFGQLKDHTFLTLLTAIISLAISIEIVNYYFIMEYPYLTKTILERNVSSIMNQFTRVGSLVLISTLASAMLKLVNDYAVIQIRELLMIETKVDLENRKIFFTNVDNPDQRATDEVKLFLIEVLKCFTSLVVKPYFLFLYFVQCLERTGWELLLAAILQYTITTIIMSLTVKKTSDSLYKLDSCEGDYRRVFVNFFDRFHQANSIGIIDLEVRSLIFSIKKVSKYFREYANWNFLLVFLSGFIISWSTFSLYIVIAVLVVKGRYDSLSQEDLVFFIQLAIGLNMKFTSTVNDFVDIFKSLPGIRTSYNRIKIIFTIQEDENSQFHPSKKQGRILSITNLPLFENSSKYVNFNVIKGKRYLINGNNGNGKSTMIKKLAQRIRNYSKSRANGDIVFNINLENVIIVLQDLYEFPEPFQQYLRDFEAFLASDEGNYRYNLRFLALYYMVAPKKINQGLRDITKLPLASMAWFVDVDGELSILKRLKIIPNEFEIKNRAAETRFQRADPFASTRKYEKLFSPGEMQTLILASILYRLEYGRERHFHNLVILDEATSQMSEEAEAAVMDLLLVKDITLISVGHRKSLERFHDEIIEFRDILTEYKRMEDE